MLPIDFYYVMQNGGFDLFSLLVWMAFGAIVIAGVALFILAISFVFYVIGWCVRGMNNRQFDPFLKDYSFEELIVKFKEFKKDKGEDNV